MIMAADAIAMLRAVLSGEDYPPPGFEDTPGNRALYEQMMREVEELPAGVLPKIPWDQTEMPD